MSNTLVTEQVEGGAMNEIPSPDQVMAKAKLDLIRSTQPYADAFSKWARMGDGKEKSIEIPNLSEEQRAQMKQHVKSINTLQQEKNYYAKFEYEVSFRDNVDQHFSRGPYSGAGMFVVHGDQKHYIIFKMVPRVYPASYSADCFRN
jgi:hypothetical protein